MPARVRIATILTLFVLAVLHLQGCSVSEDVGTPADDSEAIRLALATSTGSTVLVADGVSSVPVQLTVTDTSGQPVPDTPVTFTTDAGTLSAPAEAAAAQDATTRANGDGSSVTVNTGADGVAQVTLTASTTVETATVIAEVMGFSQAITINFISGIPTQVAVTAIPLTVGTGTTTTIQATVTTDTGAVVEGVTVTFSVSVNNSGGSLLSTTGLTDSNGQITAVYIAGFALGTDTIQAEISGNITETVAVTVQATSVAATSLDLLVSSPQLDSDDSQTVTLTALVRDQNNNFVPDVSVTFAANSGGVQVTNDTTDVTGTATALLSTAGDPTNRTIDVTATVGTLTSSNTVTVTGTSLALSGTSTLVLGQTATLSILLQDSGGNGIANQTVTVNSALGNTLNAATVSTDSNGQATLEVTADVGGTDDITASALAASATLTLTISSDNFVFTTPTADTGVNLGNVQNIIVHWDQAGVPQVGQTINFFATRGTLSAISEVTDGNGDTPIITITSANAGPTVITAVAETPGGPSSQVDIEFLATEAFSLILQASPTSLGTNPQGSADQQSIISAVVRDSNNNLVRNQTVSFTLIDVSGGSIFPSSAITDSFGRASTVYTAGAAPSAQDGVILDAEVVEPVPTTPCVRDPSTDTPLSGPCGKVALTVSQRALFVVLGTSNLILPLSDTQYAKPYSVLVTDANGTAIEGATVELNVFPTRYQKGFYGFVFDQTGNCIGWGKSLTIDPLILSSSDNADQACNNEDVNRNGILEVDEDINNNGMLDAGEDRNNNGILDPDEDQNNNSKLDPGNIATVPGSITTDASGFAFFDITYAREFTWVEVQLEARASVAGSESASDAIFFLPGLASDFDDCEVAPPGQISPYGVATTCTCDEATNPLCLSTTQPGLTSIALSTNPSNLVVDAAAGTTASVITATVTDLSGNPVPGEILAFSVEGLGNTILTRFSVPGTQATTATTDANGQAMVTVLSGDVSGTAVVTAQFGSTSATAAITITDPTNILIVTANPGSIPGDGVSTSIITALLINANRNPIIGATIDFTLEPPGPGSPVLGSIAATGVTDATGRATATLLSQVAQGQTTVRATFGAVSDTTSVTFASPPAGNVASISVVVRIVRHPKRQHYPC
jgi:protocatechuate 3,4-dioxygenase beta subunit